MADREAAVAVGDHRGYDGGKKRKGRKRHLLVDTLGLLMVVLVTGANLDDGTTAPQLLTRVSPPDFPRLITIFGDNKDHNHSMSQWLSQSDRPGTSKSSLVQRSHVENQRRPPDAPSSGSIRRRPEVPDRQTTLVG